MRIFAGLITIRFLVVDRLDAFFRFGIRISLLLVRVAGCTIMTAIAAFAAAKQTKKKNGENLPNLTHSE